MTNSFIFSNKASSNLIALKLLAMLVTPFDQDPAFKSGAIDHHGKYIKNKKSSYKPNYLERLLINVKKLINKLPGGENKIKNLVSAMWLIRECVNQNLPESYIDESAISKWDSCCHTKNPEYNQLLNVLCWFKIYPEALLTEEGEIANTTSSFAGVDLPLGSHNPFVHYSKKTDDELIQDIKKLWISQNLKH